ncbi:MAG: hypothetical protein ACR2NW_09695 [Thermodesulfobacteriota bacterium]
MNELLFALFILVGFLNGMLFFGHIFYFSLYSFPMIIKLTRDENFGSTITELVKKVYPAAIWLLVTIALIIIINKFFTFYNKLFYCGLAISLIFTIGELLNRRSNLKR